jgi:hypothetical protein
MKDHQKKIIIIASPTRARQPYGRLTGDVEVPLKIRGRRRGCRGAVDRNESQGCRVSAGIVSGALLFEENLALTVMIHQQNHWDN